MIYNWGFHSKMGRKTRCRCKEQPGRISCDTSIMSPINQEAWANPPCVCRSMSAWKDFPCPTVQHHLRFAWVVPWQSLRKGSPHVQAPKSLLKSRTPTQRILSSITHGSGGLVRKTIFGANPGCRGTVPQSHEIRQHSIMAWNQVDGGFPPFFASQLVANEDWDLRSSLLQLMYMHNMMMTRLPPRPPTTTGRICHKATVHQEWMELLSQWPGLQLTVDACHNGLRYIPMRYVFVSNKS